MSREVRTLIDLQFQRVGGKPGEVDVCPKGTTLTEIPFGTLPESARNRRHGWGQRVVTAARERGESIAFFKWNGQIRSAVVGKSVERLRIRGRLPRRRGSAAEPSPVKFDTPQD